VAALVSHKTSSFSGTLSIPGDKSISHRALILGASATGETEISGILESEDVLCTADALSAMGVTIERDKANDKTTSVWRVLGRGVGGLCEPSRVLDMGNSGTAARLLLGLLATHPFSAVLSGDASLSKRPMKRVMTPLSLIGATFTARNDGLLPISVTGTPTPMPTRYTSPVASAQIKSAILLAGLNTPGLTQVVEPQPSRDHTELMLRHFGAKVTVEPDAKEGVEISLSGQPELSGQKISVPGDPSSAAFPLAAALLVPGSRLTLENVGVNPLRTGLFETLQEMGAHIEYANQRTIAGEDVADIYVEERPLYGVHVPPQRAARMIDEYPILAVIAARATGETRMSGLAELRLKESDRLSAMAQGLEACGVSVEASEDEMVVHGVGDGAIEGGATIAVNLDHRIAMAFLVLGGISEKPITIDEDTSIATSFPGFVERMSDLGADIRPT
jgi:3-phosphoshikimate 1-carboxyvinyltransferase